MSKRVRTSRVANSKKSRRPRPSGEREVAGRESLSAVDFDDARGSSPSLASEAPSAPSATSTAESDRPDASLTPSATTAEVAADAVVPALVTGETPPPPPASSDEVVVPGDATPPPAAAMPAVEAKVEAPAVKVDAEASTDAPGLASEKVSGLKKKKKKSSIGGTRPEDVNASSGALSLNEPLARGFYESAPPPDHDDDEIEAAQPVALSPAILERKAKLRRIVMGVFAAASLVVLIVAGKTLLTKSAPVPEASHATEAAPAPAKETPKPAAPAKPEQAVKAEPTPAPVPAPSGSAASDAKAEAKEEPKAEDKPKGDPAELKKTATKLYNSGKLKDAIPALRDAIAADPDDAMPYLFLGDALTNTGKWPEAKEAYNECVRHAKKGPKYECAAMGGHK